MNRVLLEKKVLSENDRIASELREKYREHGILCLNFISSPGAGKTALLERTLEGLPRETRVAALTGDIQTDNDAQRLARFGFPVQQISSGGACHLDARMVERALAEWDLNRIDLLFVENVGNLVCPTSYDLGEATKIVLLSVTEGDDKPLKYPATFFKASLMLLNKIDLLPHVPFDLERARENARRVHPGIEILEVSCTTGTGLEAWQQWLAHKREEIRHGRETHPAKTAARGD
jgi:hydrogenase nickel incorporation protein HypB